MEAHELSITPLEPVVASMAYDMWCFGVMLYELATGRRLFDWDNDEEVDNAELAKIVAWQLSVKKQALAKVADRAMRRLIGLLLEKDPVARPESWDDVIAFLSPDNAADGGKIEALLKGMEGRLTDKIGNLSQQLHDSTKHLSVAIAKEGSATRKFMIQLQEITTPYLFDIVDEDEPGLLGHIKTSAQRELAEQAPTATEFKSPEAAIEAIEKRVSWCRRLRDRANKILKSPAQKAKEFLLASRDKTVYLRLLCGVTLEPVVIYAIPVHENNEDVERFLETSAKMVGVGLKVAAVYNCAAKVGSVATRFFGFSIPTLGKNTMDRMQGAKDFIEELQTTSDEDIAGLKEKGDAGINMDELAKFSAYLKTLEARDEIDGVPQPTWKDVLYPALDPANPELLTWTTKEHAGEVGGKQQKDAIEKFQLEEPSRSNKPPVEPNKSQQRLETDSLIAEAGMDENDAPRTSTADSASSPVQSDTLLAEMRKMVASQAEVHSKLDAQAAQQAAEPQQSRSSEMRQMMAAQVEIQIKLDAQAAQLTQRTRVCAIM